VRYDDGSEFTFATLERPNAHFDAAGVIRHEGCAAIPSSPYSRSHGAFLPGQCMTVQNDRAALVAGVMTHINFAADLTTPDAGCNAPPPPAAAARGGKPRSCAECKFYRHCGTAVRGPCCHSAPPRSALHRESRWAAVDCQSCLAVTAPPPLAGTTVVALDVKTDDPAAAAGNVSLLPDPNCTKVRTTPCRPRSWANFSLL
jgi:hypothetical protein